ncbi:MAG: FmdB family zinc ribbon protein [bacterium]
MPIYEYKCRTCNKKSTFITYSISQPVEKECQHCGSGDLIKLISRVRMIQSEESRLEKLADPSNLAGLDENDPKSMAKFMKKMGREMGEEIDNDEIDQMVEESMQGEGAGSDEGPGL